MFIKNLYPFYAPEGDGTGGGISDSADDIELLGDDPEIEDKSNEDEDEVEEDEEGQETKEDEEKVEDNKEEEQEEEDTEETEEEKENTEEEEEETKEFSIKALKQAYPKLFKEFPEIKESIYRERKFTQIFGSVEDAEEAAEKAETFDVIANDVRSGNSRELLNSLNEDQLKEFSLNFLPTLQSKNKDLFFAVTDRILSRALKAAVHHAHKTQDKNLAAASKFIARFAFGEDEIPDFDNEKPKANPEKEAWEKEKLETQRAQLIEQENTVYRVTDEKLTNIINEGFSSDDSMSSFVKSAIVEKIKIEVDSQIAKDKPFQAQITSLWKRAQREGFTKEAKSRITSAYLARARRIIPSVRAKIRSEANKPAAKKENNSEKRQISSTSRGNAGKSTLDPKKIDWKKVSDEDILAGD